MTNDYEWCITSRACEWFIFYSIRFHVHDTMMIHAHCIHTYEWPYTTTLVMYDGLTRVNRTRCDIAWQRYRKLGTKGHFDQPCVPLWPTIDTTWHVHRKTRRVEHISEIKNTTQNEFRKPRNSKTYRICVPLWPTIETTWEEWYGIRSVEEINSWEWRGSRDSC